MTVVAHISTVHPRSDVRIRVKQASTLARRLDGDCLLFVNDGLGDETDESGLRIVDIGARTAGRLGRMVLGMWAMARALQAYRPGVVHFHDPELLILGLWLKLIRTRVVYDVHEDVPRQIIAKPYLPRIFRTPAAAIVAVLEWLSAWMFDGIVAATPAIAARFPASKTVLIRNFPVLAELACTSIIPYAERDTRFAYVGGLTRNRGIMRMVEAMGQLEGYDGARLVIAGRATEAFMTELVSMPGWRERVDHLGWVDRDDIASLLGSTRAGLVVLAPIPNYIEALPVKMFEYMAAGLPVIASDFPIWREILNDAGCGILVDPQDPVAIAAAIRSILDDPAKAEAMGRRGAEAVRRCYNWEAEAEILVEFYNNHLDVRCKSSSVA